MKTFQNKTRSILYVGAALVLGIGLATAQQNVPAVTGDPRVDKLLGQMTLEEKLTLIHGTHEEPAVYQGQAGYLEGIPRLGVPGLRFADGPPGLLTRHPSQAETATMGVAATFSVRDAEQNGVVIGREARALGIDVALQPFVNVDRDLQFGRGYNTFGEDPFLTASIGAAEIRGIQSQHVMAQVKHFVGYDTDAGNVWIEDQTLHEVYVAPFAAAVQAGVASFMCSYNRLNGKLACGNESTLTRILRDELGFKGFVTSDWGATHAVNFINAGLDMEMPGPPGPGGFPIPSFFDSEAPPPPPAQHLADIAESMLGGRLPEEPPLEPFAGGDFGLKLDAKKMPEALKDGAVSEAAVTRAAGHVLFQIAQFGYLDGLSKHQVSAPSIDENAKIIEKTGEDAVVLLKNDDGALPLKAADLDQVVLIGPGAGQVMAIGISGERSLGLPERQVGPLDAMRKISGNSNIRFAVDDDMTGTTVPARALSHHGQPGLERIDASGASTHTDAQLNFTVQGRNALPPNSTLTWKGTLSVPHAGNYWMYLQALGTNASLSIDGKRLGSTGAVQGAVHGDILQANRDNAVPTTDGLDNVRRAVDLTEGAHAVEVRITPDTSNAPVQVRLNWYTPEQRKVDHQAAIAAAQEREGRRRLSMDPPETGIWPARRAERACG